MLRLKYFIGGFFLCVGLVICLAFWGYYSLIKSQLDFFDNEVKRPLNSTGFRILLGGLDSVSYYPLVSESQLMQYKTNKKYVFINFWATWCGPCIAEMPYFSELAQDSVVQGKIDFLFLSDEPEDIQRKFIEKKGYLLPFFRYKKDLLPSYMNHANLPSNYLIDVDNGIVYFLDGAANWNDPLHKSFLKSILK